MCVKTAIYESIRLIALFRTIEANYTDRHEASRGLFATAMR